jgi:Fic family protein
MDILAADSGAFVEQHSDDLQEVQNYIIALDYGLVRMKELPLSLRLIKEVHYRLMQGVRGSQAMPGEFRAVQNWIGIPGCTVYMAKFVPPAPEYLMEVLGEFESFLHYQQLPPLIRIALCHYQFEVIHPFLDGNGRIGRLLITLLLIDQKMLPSPLLYLSAFFEATRTEYYRQLYNISREGSWREWLIYFLNGVAIQSEDALSRAERINDLLITWRATAAGLGSSILLDIVDRFAANPYVTIKKVAQDLNVVYSTAQRAIQKLEAAGIIKQMNDNKRDKVYCATEILSILEEPTKLSTDF